jgi:ankyrin repeat protein
MDTRITCPNCGHDFNMQDARSPARRHVHAKDEECTAPPDCEPHGPSVGDAAWFFQTVAFWRAQAEHGDTALHVAARYGKLEIVQYVVVTDGGKVNAKNNNSFTLLHWAASENSIDVVKHLVSVGADIHAKDKDGCTPLHFAARNNSDVDVAKFLVSEGADVNGKDLYGHTPLLLAAGWNGNNAVLRFLVSEGADINAKDKSGRTPLDHAKRNRTKVRYLKSIGAVSGS